MDQRRHLAGTPAGGRFAAHRRQAADIDLGEGLTPQVRALLDQQPGIAAEGTVVDVEGSWHDPHHTVTVGVIDEASIRAYRNGQCHALALALAERTGWKVVAIGPSECFYDPDCPEDNDSAGMCECQLRHLAVQAPDGRLADIEGLRPLEDFLLSCPDPEGDVVLPVAEDRLVDIISTNRCWRRPDMATARGFVDAALAY